MSMEQWGNCIDWFFRIFQILTFMGFIIQSVNKTGYSDNVQIQMLLFDELDTIYKRFQFIYHYNMDEWGQKFIIYPNGVDIVKIDFYELEYNVKNNKLIQVQKIYEMRDIKSERALLLQTILPEGIPRLKIVWETSDGKIGEHIFSYNGFSGYQDVSYYEYKLTRKKKILSLIGL